MVTTRSQTRAAASHPPARPLRRGHHRRHRHGPHPSPSPSTPTKPTSIAPLPQRPLQRPKSPSTFGLIQEHLQHNLYFILVQSILWNQTSGRTARPVLHALLAQHPDPASLALASVPALAGLLRPIGLHNIRAARLVALAKAWVAAPPTKERRYRKLHYPRKGCGADVGVGEVLGEGDTREGWEVAHLPGVGSYALDSFRIFCRDRLRGVCCVEDGREVVEPEWKRVLPADKDLRAYLAWKWRGEGWVWDPLTGKSTRADVIRDMGPDGL